MIFVLGFVGLFLGFFAGKDIAIYSKYSHWLTTCIASIVGSFIFCVGIFIGGTIELYSCGFFGACGWIMVGTLGFTVMGGGVSLPVFGFVFYKLYPKDLVQISIRRPNVLFRYKFIIVFFLLVVLSFVSFNNWHYTFLEKARIQDNVISQDYPYSAEKLVIAKYYWEDLENGAQPSNIFYKLQLDKGDLYEEYKVYTDPRGNNIQENCFHLTDDIDRSQPIQSDCMRHFTTYNGGYSGDYKEIESNIRSRIAVLSDSDIKDIKTLDINGDGVDEHVLLIGGGNGSSKKSLIVISSNLDSIVAAYELPNGADILRKINLKSESKDMLLISYSFEGVGDQARELLIFNKAEDPSSNFSSVTVYQSPYPSFKDVLEN